MTEEGPWTPEIIDEITCNPVYVGIYPFPKVMDEETWINTAKKTVEQESLEHFLKTMIKALKKTYNEGFVPYGYEEKEVE